METRSQKKRRDESALHKNYARPTPTPVSPASPSSDEDIYLTPGNETSNSDDGPPSPPPPPRPVRRRGRPPTASLAPTGHRAPTKAPATGGVVRRMKWTSDINEDVMRAYYEATEGGIALTAYRDRMRSLFQVLQPTVTVSTQRLSDQVRAIQRLQLLDGLVLDRLRSEVRSTRMVTETQSVPLSLPSLTTQLNCESGPTDHADITDVSQDNEHLRRTLEDAILEFKVVPMSARPRLPRLPIHKHTISLVRVIDGLLIQYFESSKDLMDTHSILYCGAIAVCRAANVKFPNKDRTARRNDDVPAWQGRIERRIATARTLIAKLICFRSGNHRPRVMRFVVQAFAGTNISPKDYIARSTERIDYLKQKVYAWANRIRRYKKRVDRYTINRMFQSDQKGVYRNWERPTECVTDRCLPSAGSVYAFWHNIWSVSVSHTEGGWFDIVERACESIPEMGSITIDPLDIGCAIHQAHNWKSPGPDGLHNFWLKWFKSSHARLATQFQQALVGGSIPHFMTTGITHLLHKSGCTTDPKNYRPITCLPTIYKLLTSILRTKITNHIYDNNILASTQNGCRPGSRGTKELLLIDMIVSHQVRKNRKNLFTAWIDYKKAYDSVPHTWLRRVLELYKIDTSLRTLLESCMRQWTTSLYLPGCEAEPELIKIERGIFQGDSLSPLWFCLALNPLSTLLCESGLGYRLRRGSENVISHLLYMDDLKLFSSKKSELMELLKITENFSNSISMEFGVDKCAFIHVEQGRVVSSEDLQLSENVAFRSLSETESYKYLGIPEALGIVDTDVKQSVKDRFFARLMKVLNSLLSGGNKVKAFNGWVMPVLTYTFGILRWTQTELDALDRRVRCLLTKCRMHHPRSSVMRLYLPRKCGGRGFLNAKCLHNREVCNLREYFRRAESEMHKAAVAVDKGLTPLSLANEHWRKLQVLGTVERKEVWKGKELHGRFYRALTSPDVDHDSSVSWLRFGNLFGETEGFACAIADEVIMTRNYRRYILKDGTVDICRACHRPGESIRHIISGCSHLANGEYLHRHNQVARIIHQQLALKYHLVDLEVPYYQYVPAPVLENNHVTLYWDRSIITDRTIVANKPDIVVLDRSARRALLVDITIPHDENIVKAEKEKLTKYLDLAHEITAMWRVDSTIIVPIVVSVNGLIPKSLDQHLQRLSLGSWLKSLIQKAVLLDTARIVRKFLSLEP